MCVNKGVSMTPLKKEYIIVICKKNSTRTNYQLNTDFRMLHLAKNLQIVCI